MTDEHADDVARVCAAWGRGPVVMTAPLATTGFSGLPVRLVVLAGTAGRFVLKPFAPHVTRERAEWVHGMMRHARAAGVTEVPEVLTAADGGSVVDDADGQLWELVQFVDGQPCALPTPARAAAALDVLARLHAALRSLPGDAPERGHSPGVERRMKQASELLVRPWSTRIEAMEDLCGEADRLLAMPRGRRGLTAVATAGIGVMHRQAVVRDIWSDHVLFDQSAPDRVAGIVDFHAAGIDTPLTDVARLLGSWERPDPRPKDAAVGLTECWPGPLAAYERTRGEPLTAAERWLCDWLHASAVICSLDNWFRWTLEENRRFPDANRARERIRSLMGELPQAIDWLAHAGNRPV